MHKRFYGSALSQYGLIILIISLFIVPIFFIFGQNIKSYFTWDTFSNTDANSQAIVDDNSLIGKSIIAGNVKGGELGGAPDNPMRKCAGNICTIDYGPIVLNSIPSNFADIVETSGTAGGTEVALDLMNQLAIQMEQHPEKYPPEQVEKIKNLMGYGKDIIALEKFAEAKLDKYGPQFNTMINEYAALYKEFKANNLSKEEHISQQQLLSDKYSNLLKEIYGYNPYENVDNQNNVSIEKLKTFDNKEIPLNMLTVNNMLDPNNIIYYQEGGANAINKLSSTMSMVNEETLSEDEILKNPQINALMEKNYDNYINGTIALNTNIANISMIDEGTPDLDDRSLSIVGSYLNEVKSLMNDKDVDPLIKQITSSLSKEIYELSKNVQQKSSLLTLEENAIYSNIEIFKMMVSQSKTDNESIDGPFGEYALFESVQKQFNNTPSTITRIDLSLICDSHRGEFNPDNVNCNKK